MLLHEIMKREPITAQLSDRLGDAHRKMMAFGIRHLPILDGKHLVGMLSERDVFEYRAKSEREDWWRASISAAMTAPAHFAGPDDSLTEAAGRMATEKIGALPIVQLGHLVGLITVTDVLAAEVDAAMR